MLPIGFEEFLFDLFFPFILFFSIFYIILHQVKVFGDPSSLLVRKVNLIIAFSLSILVVWVNPFQISFKLFLSQLFSTTAIVILGLVFLIFFSALIGLATGVTHRWLNVTLAAGLVILVFSITGVFNYFLRTELSLPRIDFWVIGTIAVTLVIFGILWWLFK